MSSVSGGNQSPDDRSRPDGIFAVYPREGATTNPTPRIGASLRAPPVEVAFSWRLFVDDHDVSDAGRVAELMTHPRSAVQVSYEAAEPMAPGEHRARVEYSDGLGRSGSYAWSFVVAPSG